MSLGQETNDLVRLKWEEPNRGLWAVKLNIEKGL
jgi:hypothetical protein